MKKAAAPKKATNPINKFIGSIIAFLFILN